MSYPYDISPPEGSIDNPLADPSYRLGRLLEIHEHMLGSGFVPPSVQQAVETIQNSIGSPYFDTILDTAEQTFAQVVANND